MRIPKKGSSEKWHVCHHFLKNNYSSGDFFFGGKVLKRTSSVGCFEGHYPRKKKSTTKKGLIVGICQFFSPQGNKKTPDPLPKKPTSSPPSNPTGFFWDPWGWWDSMAIGRVRRPSPALKGEGWRVVRNQRILISLKQTASFHLQNEELEDISFWG